MGDIGKLKPDEVYEVYIVKYTKAEAQELARSISNLFNESVNIRPKNPDAVPV